MGKFCFLPIPGEWTPCRKRNSHSRSTAQEWEDPVEISGQGLGSRKGPQSSDKNPREKLIPGALGSHKHPSFLLRPLNSNTTSLLQNLYFEAFSPVILSKRRNNMASCTSSFSHSSLFIENPSYSALDSWLTISIASKDCFNCHLLSNCQEETDFPKSLP